MLVTVRLWLGSIVPSNFPVSSNLTKALNNKTERSELVFPLLFKPITIILRLDELYQLKE